MKNDHVSKGTKNTWDFLGFSEGEGAELGLRIMIFNELMKNVEKRKLSARELEKLLDERQPRISDLLNKKLSKFSSDKLFLYLSKVCPDREYSLKSKKKELAELA